MPCLKLGTCVGALIVAAAAEAAPYQPTGPWILNGEVAQCTLSRDFQQDGKLAKLIFQALPFDRNVVVIVETTDSKVPIGWSYPVLVAGDTANLRKTPMQGLVAADKSQHYARFWITRQEFENLANKLGLGLIELDWTAAFRLPKFPSAASALADCQRRLFANVASSMGFSSDETRRIVQPAQLPDTLIRKGPPSNKLPVGHDIEDAAVAAYIVSPDGQMVGCALVQKAKAEDLNSGACHSWGRARFIPAKDAHGQPVRGISFERSSW